MRKIVKQTVTIVLAYVMLIGVVPFSKFETDVKAETSIPSYLKVEDGYVINGYKYKDKTYIDTPTVHKYYNGSLEKNVVAEWAYGTLSDKEVLIYEDFSSNEQKIFNLETGQVSNEIEGIKTIFKNNIMDKYTVNTNIYFNEIKRTTDGIWAEFEFSYKDSNQNQRTKIGLINENGTIIDLGIQAPNNYISDIYYGENYISIVFGIVGQGQQSTSKKVKLIDKKNGTILNSFEIVDGEVIKVINNKIWVTEKINYNSPEKNTSVLVYEYSTNNNKVIKTMNNIPYSLLRAYAVDNNENFWYVNDGYVKMVNGDNVINKYKVDERMTNITLYDENHILVTGYIYSSEAGKTWNGYTIINNEGVNTNKWVQENGKWYYYDENGQLATGWVNYQNSWYYLDKATGAMKTGWLLENGKYYYLTASGAMKTGWLLENGKYYYLTASGAMKTGWLLENGQYYYLTTSGAMKTGWLLENGVYYYLETSGNMATGWKYVAGQWYYLYSNGAMATSGVIDGWRIGSNGAATKI